MNSTEIHVTIDCTDLEAQAAFWSAALGYEPSDAEGQYRTLRAPAGATGMPAKVELQQVAERPAEAKNRVHLDLICGEGFEAEADRIVSLGATRMSDVVREYGCTWIVLRDPEGNELCVCDE